jgi:hypothetical protein
MEGILVAVDDEKWTNAAAESHWITMSEPKKHTLDYASPASPSPRSRLAWVRSWIVELFLGVVVIWLVLLAILYFGGFAP